MLKAKSGRYVHWQRPRSQNYSPFFCLRVGRLTLLQFPPPPFFSDKSGRLAFQKKERVKLYTQLKKARNPNPRNIQELLTTTVLLTQIFKKV